MQVFVPSDKNEPEGKSSRTPFLPEASLHFSIFMLFIKRRVFYVQALKHCKNAGKTSFFCD